MTARVNVEIRGIRRVLPARHTRFTPGREFALRGSVGPIGLTAAAADLLDVATSVFWIERTLPGHRSSNTPELFKVTFRLREPGLWTATTVAALAETLRVLGNAEWEIEVVRGAKMLDPHVQVLGKRSRVNAAAMLSGGMDSTCGAALLSKKCERVQLVSYYTKQRARQQKIAEELGHARPAQFWLEQNQSPGRGRAFYYRSFFFTSIAAVVADSFGARTITQHENGVLATAIPPSPAWRMTRHAHPSMHRALEQVLSGVLGGTWTIENPFIIKTKREVLRAAEGVVGVAKMRELLEKSDTCWYHWSNNIAGASKPPGVACGACVPCIVRRTACPGDAFHLDLMQDRVRNHLRQGLSFRSYAAFAKDILAAEASDGQVYRVLPATAHELIRQQQIDLPSLARLFRTFAAEFEDTFNV